MICCQGPRSLGKCAHMTSDIAQIAQTGPEYASPPHTRVVCIGVWKTKCINTSEVKYSITRALPRMPSDFITYELSMQQPRNHSFIQQMFTETHPWQPLYRLQDLPVGGGHRGQATVLNYEGTAGQSRVCVQHKYPMLPTEAGDISEKVTFELSHKKREHEPEEGWRFCRKM